jgi:hypothetical protein
MAEDKKSKKTNGNENYQRTKSFDFNSHIVELTISGADKEVVDSFCKKVVFKSEVIAITAKEANKFLRNQKPQKQESHIQKSQERKVTSSDLTISLTLTERLKTRRRFFKHVFWFEELQLSSTHRFKYTGIAASAIVVSSELVGCDFSGDGLNRIVELIGAGTGKNKFEEYLVNSTDQSSQNSITFTLDVSGEGSSYTPGGSSWNFVGIISD